MAQLTPLPPKPPLAPPKSPQPQPQKPPQPQAKPAQGQVGGRTPWKIWKPTLPDLLAEVPGALYVGASVETRGGAVARVIFSTFVHGFNERGHLCELLLRQPGADVLNAAEVAERASANLETLTRIQDELKRLDREVRSGIIHDQPISGYWKKPEIWPRNAF